VIAHRPEPQEELAMNTASSADPRRAKTGHAYGVRLVVKGAGRYGAKHYWPWCECGWEGEPQAVEYDAARAAFTHATGRDPGILERQRTRKGSPQDEALFDKSKYKR